MKTSLIILSFLASGAFYLNAERKVMTLRDGWEFTKGTPEAASQWQKVKVPHDWAIYGPFDRANDLQTVAVEQNGEKVATAKTGRTGGLPFIGKGSYRIDFETGCDADI